MNRSRRSPAAWCAALWLVLALSPDLAQPARASVSNVPPVFLSEKRLAEIRTRIGDRTEPTFTAYQQMRKDADAALDGPAHVPEVWHVPGFYGHEDAHRAAKGGLMDDGNAAYTLALAYRLTGDERYAAAARRLVLAWAGLKTLEKGADSTLAFSYHFPALIFAADLIRPSAAWTPGDDGAFGAFVREKAVPMNTMAVRNNWGNWGTVLVAAAGAFLHDDALLGRAVRRWKELLDSQVDADGVLHEEVYRNGDGAYGIWYSHFSLMPATIVAEIARLHGIDLYGYRSPTGGSLHAAFDRLAPWANHPDTFPYYQGKDLAKLHRPEYVGYFELLNARWPNPEATAMLQARRPLTAEHSTPDLTLTHGGLDPDL